MKIELKTAVTATIFCLSTMSAQADFEDLLGSFSTGLEEESAAAALQTYLRLIETSGCTDNLLRDPGLDGAINGLDSSLSDSLSDSISDNVIGSATDSRGSLACTGRTFKIFSNVREIIHTGNELTGSGPNLFSLGSSAEGLGFALRWLAAEEFAAQGDMSSDFVSAQVSGLSSRMTALRFGARGFQFAGAPTWDADEDYAGTYGNSGGSAGSDVGYSRLGGFLNIQYGEGNREATGQEDAFDMESAGATFGLDWRINDIWIVGVVAGISKQEIDFDSTQSIVDGGITSDGYSVMPFFMAQRGNAYFSGSYGYQSISFDSVRSIRYPSFNPDIESANTQTISSADSSVNSLFAEVGYSFMWRNYSVEPYGNINSSSVSIDEFIEDDINDDGFDLIIEAQDFSTLDATVGIKLQGTFTVRPFVVIPYLTLEQVNQIEDGPRTMGARYEGLDFDDSVFQITTEELDSAYNTVTIGMSSVLRGGREKNAGGTVAGDVQGFVSYKTITGLEGYNLWFVSGGLRVAF